MASSNECRPRQGSSPHLTHETSAAAGQRTGPIHPPESFVPAKSYPWGGGEYIVCGCRLNPSVLDEVFSSLAAAMHSTEWERAPQTIYSLRPSPRCISSGRKTHKTSFHPLSAGRSGSVLTSLTKSHFKLVDVRNQLTRSATKAYNRP